MEEPLRDSVDWCALRPGLAARRIRELVDRNAELRVQVLGLEADRAMLAEATALSIAMPQPYRRLPDGTELHNEELGVVVRIARESLELANAGSDTVYRLVCQNIANRVERALLDKVFADALYGEEE